jgi:hypothetical protein
MIPEAKYSWFEKETRSATGGAKGDVRIYILGQDGLIPKACILFSGGSEWPRTTRKTKSRPIWI